MKKFTVPCDFGGVTAPFTIYIGEPEPNRHPLHFQADWLSKHRGGTIPGDVMDSISKLFELAKKNNVSFEELCVYALTSDENNTSSPNRDAPPPPLMTAPAPPQPEDDYLDDEDDDSDDLLLENHPEQHEYTPQEQTANMAPPPPPPPLKSPQPSQKPVGSVPPPPPLPRKPLPTGGEGAAE